MADHDTGRISARQLRLPSTSILFSNEEGELDVDLAKPFVNLVKLILYLIIAQLVLTVLLTLIMIITVLFVTIT